MTAKTFLNILGPKVRFTGRYHFNRPPEELVKDALAKQEVYRHKSSAIVVNTGIHTGRAPLDNFKVDTLSTHGNIDWGKVNQPISPDNFNRLEGKIKDHLTQQDDLYIFDGFVGAGVYRKKVRVVTPYTYLALFSHHLFIRPEVDTPAHPKPDLTVFCAPDCYANPATDGTRSATFIVSNYDKGMVLIGGTRYAGEIKKSVFTYMNYILPNLGVFPMHCSANMGENGETAIFFGLSGTGKTTLSADPNRRLIGDDEHGWGPKGIFNLEGGCYPKVINLDPKKEPLIWRAVHKLYALHENVIMDQGGEFDFANSTKPENTENTRAAYPLDYIKNSLPSDIYPHPKYIIFLTADAFGLMPAVAKLDANAALYHLLSGYTSKIPGTEKGVDKPEPTFSYCYGHPFMPRPALVYAQLLKSFTTKYGSKVYLVNTGWQGGPYGAGGERISIKDTRRIISAILCGELDNQQTVREQFFNLDVPIAVEGIDNSVLDPKSLWGDQEAYASQAVKLVEAFEVNFAKFRGVPEAVMAARPGIYR